MKPEYVLNGEVEFTGEDCVDFGKVNIKDNIIDIQHGKLEDDME